MDEWSTSIVAGGAGDAAAERSPSVSDRSASREIPQRWPTLCRPHVLCALSRSHSAPDLARTGRIHRRPCLRHRRRYAPESGQFCRDAQGGRYRCGQRAAFALADRIGSDLVNCTRKDTDRYGRMVAVCLHKGADLSAWLTHEGWALAYREYSSVYIPQEAIARAAKRGMWAGEFTPPWEWRQDRRD
jgi:hypothetical protein